MRKIRWGIIGAGNISSTFATALGHMEDVELLGVASRDYEKGQAFADKFGFKKVYSSYEALAKDEDIDVVYIGTPHSEHVKNAELCLKNKKAVLCEKAFTTNSSETRYLMRLAHENQVFLMEAMWTKFLPTTKMVKEWIREGRIGKVQQINASFGFRRDLPENHRLLNPELSGGALLDVGVYPITYATYMMGKLPSKVTSFVNKCDTGVDVHNSIMFHFDQGEIAMLSSAVNAEVGKVATIIGEKGRIEIPLFWSAKEAFLYDEEGKLVDTFKEESEYKGYEHEISEVNECIRENKLESALLPLQDTLDIMTIMDELRESWGIIYPHERHLYGGY